MTTENSTTQAPAATLTVGELFAEFYTSEFATYDTLGKERFRFAVENLLEPSEDHIGIDYFLIPYEIDDPDYRLEEIESELMGALSNVRLARTAWEDFKSKRLIHEDAMPERYSAGEKEAA